MSLRSATRLASTLLVVVSADVASQEPSDSLATLRVRVIHGEAPVAGAIVRSGAAGGQTDAAGMATLRLAAGSHSIIASRLGFFPDTVSVTLAARQDTSLTIALDEQAAEIESIVIESTRGARRVEDSPLGVEIVDEEEVAEKTAMTPGDIAMMLNETSGLRVQTTSPS